MPSNRVKFTNEDGYELSARLELPANQHPHTFAIFAHCFTCSKNLPAVRNISRALTTEGIAVLRFDFTGLGDSEGEFEDTNFSSNVQDLMAAAKYLEDNYKGPKILIGHSLGGAAVLVAAAKLDCVDAVATIGAPYDPTHVSHLFDDNVNEIEVLGEANVSIGGRPFKVKKQFLDDLKQQVDYENLKDLRKALLVMHSPQDRTVGIENAQKIYTSAHHPKSFITLDGADHLMSDREDSIYAGNMIANWSRKYIDFPEKAKIAGAKEVSVRTGNEDYTTDVQVRKHSLTADEPEELGGNDFGPSPFELVGSGLGSCTSITMQMYAKRKGWDLEEVLVHIDHSKGPSEIDPDKTVNHFERIIEMRGNLDESQRARLMMIANKCPVHRMLESEVIIKTKELVK